MKKIVKTIIDIREMTLDETVRCYNERFRANRVGNEEIEKAVVELYESYDITDGCFSTLLARSLNIKLYKETRELEKLIEADFFENASIIINVTIEGLNKVKNEIDFLIIKISNLKAYDDNIVEYMNSRLDIFSQEFGIKIKKRFLDLD